MAPGQKPGGPFNPMNRSKLLKGTGRGSVQLRNSHSTSQIHFGRKPTSFSATQPQTASTGAKVLRTSVHQDYCLSKLDLEVFRTAVRTSFEDASTSAPAFRSNHLPPSSRYSLDHELSEIELPDDPVGSQEIAVEGFLDACFEVPSRPCSDSGETAAGETASSSQNSFAHAPACLDASSDDGSVPPELERQFSCNSANSSDSRAASAITVAIATADTVISADSSCSYEQEDRSQTQSEITHCRTQSCCNSSSSSSTTIQTPSPTSSCYSVLQSYPANVVASVLCPRALSGHLIGRNGRTAAALQLPGARWWLTDRAWKLGGASNLRLMMIQGTPTAVADVFSMVLSHINSEGAPSNSQFFKTRQGLVKAKLVLQSWLVGTVVGKGGTTIRRIMLESGAQMQVTSVLAAVSPHKKAAAARHTDDEAALQIAAPSVSALATCVRLTFEAIRRNPCYKPVAFKSAADYKQLATNLKAA